MDYEIKQLKLLKGDETYIFNYKSGEELETINTMAEWAARPDLNFDWFDAAVLCYQMGRRIGSEISDRVE